MVTPGLRRPIPCSPKPANVCLIAIERERHQDIEVVVDDAEAARHDTDNRARLGIDDDGAADDGTVAAEAPLPVSIAEHDVLWAVGDLIAAVSSRPANGGTPSASRTPSVTRTIFTSSGRANPVTLAFCAIHVPSD